MIMQSNLIAPLANHWWQSTLFAGAAALLTWAVARNREQARYWIWLASSVKFLIPFSLLVTIGSRFEWRSAPPVVPSLSLTVERIGQPFAAPDWVADVTALQPAALSIGSAF